MFTEVHSALVNEAPRTNRFFFQGAMQQAGTQCSSHVTSEDSFDMTDTFDESNSSYTHTQPCWRPAARAALYQPVRGDEATIAAAATDLWLWLGLRRPSGNMCVYNGEVVCNTTHKSVLERTVAIHLLAPHGCPRVLRMLKTNGFVLGIQVVSQSCCPYLHCTKVPW